MTHPLRTWGRLLAGAAAAGLLLTACGGADEVTPTPTPTTASASQTPSPTPSPTPKEVNVYGEAGIGMFAPAAQEARPLVYVPNTISNTVQVINPETYEIIDRFHVDREPHHVVPSWDLKTLWVNNTQGNTVTPIDPLTGTAGAPIPVEDPYNLYFTPDGSKAIIMAERLHRIDIVDPHTFVLERSLPVDCNGVNHADFNAALDVFVASCEFSGNLLVIDSGFTQILKKIDLNTIVTQGATGWP